MNDENENILFKIRYKNTSNESQNNCVQKHDNEINSSTELKICDTCIIEKEPINIGRQLVIHNGKDIYSVLSDELSYFNEKINKILSDTHNMHENLKSNNRGEKFVFEIRQNSIGDDEFYINNELASEDIFMKKLLSYKK
ncbi:MAG: hypothetical protein RSA40_00175 [Malacoplasma sp.]